jgi:hypothetical protein
MAGTPIKRARREKANQIMASEDFWEQLWEHMAEGNSLRSFVGDGTSGITYGGLLRKIQSDPVLNERFEIVRNARALANAERIEQLAEKVEMEQIDPNAAKVSIGARQWLAERMDAKRWGNKIQQDIKLTDTTQLHLQAVRDLMRTVAHVEPQNGTSDTATRSIAGARDTKD